MPSFNNNNSLINCISSPLVALIGSILLFHLLLQTQFVVGQWHNGADADAQKWPQNYPGVVVDGNRGVRRRHFPWQEDNNSNNDGWTRGVEKWNNDGSRDGSHYRRNPPSYSPGPDRQHAHGNERWENGENMKGYDERGAGGDWRHYGGRDGRWHGAEEAEDDRESNRSWFDRLLDWIFPWRWGKHSHRKSHDEDVHRRRHHSTSTSSSTTESPSHSTTTMSPSAENEEQQFRRRHQTRNETVTARLSGGPIRGLVSYAAGRDRPAHVYRGIPFAEPPLGKLRFAPLRRKRSWKMPVDATKYSPACLSNTTRTRSPQHYISEDCIYVNVFADPKCKETGSKYRGGGGCPVLFYVHGGGFAYDSATMFNDTQIVQKYASDGVIFVIAAYRLGVFGFLDLGNDHTVKRNLGMHDIIFALEWTRREIPTFGGDPDRITIMGNSAGASAVNYLCSSPAVKKEHFQQAIISSGVPFFTADANLEQSFALLDHFDCLRDNATNRTLSDRQKVECLRAVHSLELLREQQYDEQWQVFAGPERDTEILPADNYVELLKYWTPRPLLYSTTTHEFGRFRWMANDSKLVSECIKALTPFGYTSPQSFDTCMARYNDTFDVDVNMRVSYESMHAEAFLTALVNTRLGGISYVGEFELANYSNHADDMYFFFGLHTIPLNTSDVVLMDMYYPKMIKNFLHGHAPDPDWQPQDWNGRNYFRIAFNVSTNGTLLEWPHEVDGYQDVQGLDFWLRQMANVERNARLEALNESSNSSSTWNGTKWSDGGAKTWQDVFGDNAYGTNATHAMRPYHTQLPAVNSLFAMPTYNLLQEDGLNGTTSDIATGQGAVAPGPPGIGAGLLHQLPVVAPVAEFSPEYSQPSTSPLEWESASNELGKVWSAYWLTMTVAVLLAVALVMMAATKMIYRYKNARGYQPTSMDNTANGGMFTEKTRIIHANGNNGMRYVWVPNE